MEKLFQLPPDASTDDRICMAHYRMVLLMHAVGCVRNGNNKCKRYLCKDFRQIFTHVLDCSIENCTTPYCKYMRILFVHWRECKYKNLFCPICDSLREKLECRDLFKGVSKYFFDEYGQLEEADNGTIPIISNLEKLRKGLLTFDSPESVNMSIIFNGTSSATSNKRIWPEAAPSTKRVRKH